MADRSKINLNRVLSLEISEECIVGTEVSISKGLVNLNAGFKINIPVFTDLNKTIESIKGQIKANNIKAKDVVFGFSMQYFKLFPIPIPNSIPYEEIGNIVSQEGSVNAQLEISGFLSLRSTQRQEQDGITRYDVLGISVQKSFVDTANLISSRLGMKLHFLTPSFLGLSPFLSGQSQGSLVSTLWTSQIKSEFILWSGREPIYESLILTHHLNDQVTQTVNFLRAQMPGVDFNEIYICGPAVFDLELNQLPFNLKVFSLSEDVIDVGKVTQKHSLNELITSIGLALIGTGYVRTDVPNLVSPSSTSTFSSQSSTVSNVSRDRQLSGFISLSVLILIVSFFGLFFINSVLLPGVKGDSSTANNKLSENQIQIAKVLKYQKANKVFEAKIQYLSELIDKRIPWSKIFKEIASVTPKKLWIDRIEIRSEKLDIFGRSLAVDSVANFSINLNYSAYLTKNAQIVSLRKYSEDGINYVEFQIAANIDKSSEAIQKYNNSLATESNQSTESQDENTSDESTL